VSMYLLGLFRRRDKLFHTAFATALSRALEQNIDLVDIVERDVTYA
jgi:hypothetical protein